MSRQRFDTCADCGTVKWPVRGLGRVCPRCDALGAWPVIMASYRPTRPATQLQRDADAIIAGTPYDWATDGGPWTIEEGEPT